MWRHALILYSCRLCHHRWRRRHLGRCHWLVRHRVSRHLDGAGTLVDDGLWHGRTHGLALYAVRGLHKTYILSILVDYRSLDRNPWLAVHIGLLNLNGRHVLNHLATQLLACHWLLCDMCGCHGIVSRNLVWLTGLEWFRSCHHALALPLVFGLLDGLHCIGDVPLRRNVTKLTG